MYEDEASFWLDGTLHQTWARVGVQPRVDTFGMRKTAHLFGALSLDLRPRFQYQFAAASMPRPSSRSSSSWCAARGGRSSW